MKNLPAFALAFLLSLGFLSACTSKPSPAAESEVITQREVFPTVRAQWQQRWDDTLALAKKEGAVSVYALWSPATRTALTKAFAEKFGIKVEFTPFGRGAELQARAQAEKRAGLFVADIFGAGNPTLLISMKPDGLLSSIKPLLFLPKVLDPKVWRAGKVPFTNEEGLALSMIGVNIRTVVYNTNMIKDGEITSYKDLLKPQYKGKITFSDPSVTGGGNAAVSHLGHAVWGEAETTDFLRRLIVDQEVAIQRDFRIHVETVARGKYAIGLAPSPAVVSEFSELGAPVKLAVVKEDNRLTASFGALGVPIRFAHPNAAVVFINWLLTKEGQTIFARSFGSPSTRADVPVEGIDPLYIPVAGEKYYTESEDALNSRSKWLDIAKKVMEESRK